MKDSIDRARRWIGLVKSEDQSPRDGALSTLREWHALIIGVAVGGIDTLYQTPETQFAVVVVAAVALGLKKEAIKEFCITCVSGVKERLPYVGGEDCGCKGEEDEGEDDDVFLDSKAGREIRKEPWYTLGGLVVGLSPQLVDAFHYLMFII